MSAKGGLKKGKGKEKVNAVIDQILMDEECELEGDSEEEESKEVKMADDEDSKSPETGAKCTVPA